MRMIFWPNRDAKLRILFFRSEVSKMVLRSLLSSCFFEFMDKIFFYRSFQRFSFRSSISFYRRSCLLTGHTRSVFRLFKLCRHQVKSLSSFGQVVGFRKASF